MWLELKILFRRFWKAAVLFCFLLAAAMMAVVLLLQVFVDREGIRYAQQYYSYIGTVKQSYAKEPDTQVIGSKALEILRDSGCLSMEEQRIVHSGRVPGTKNLVDAFECLDLSDYCILIGKAKEDGRLTGDFPTYRREDSLVEVEQLLAGQADLETFEGALGIGLHHLPGEDLMIKAGKRYLFMGVFSQDSMRSITNTVVCTLPFPGELWPGTEAYDEVLLSNGAVEVPEGLEGEELLAWAKDILAQRGLADALEEMQQLTDMVTLQGTEDMSLLLSVADGSLFYNSGRGIQPTDGNEKVCVVNARYAQENGLSVGGTIELYDLGEGYISEEKDSCAGIESGFPFLKDVGEALEREEVSLGSFTIIGLYSFVDRRMKGNPYLYSYNDIFVPAGVLQGQADCDREPRPYTYSFRVQGKDYDRFLDLVEDPLMKKGYALKLSNSDWPSVQSMYTQMTGRYRMLFGGAVFAMAMLLLVYNVLLVVLYRQEFALRCVLGTPKRLARRSFTIPFWVTGLPAYGIVFAIAFWWGKEKLPGQLMEIAPGQVMGADTIGKMLAGMVVLCIALSYGILRGMIGWLQRKQVRELLD